MATIQFNQVNGEPLRHIIYQNFRGAEWRAYHRDAF
jgi:hypothetical protein